MKKKTKQTKSESVKEKKLSIKQRSVLASIFHIIFNIIVAVSSLVLLLLFPEAPWAAFLVVIASKFRIFAVKPRFWKANILASLTDLVFCLGIVVLIWLAGDVGAFWLQIVLTAVYIIWLIIIKPMTKQSAVAFQAAASQFVGIWALFAVANHLTLPVVILLSFGIGFSVARHILIAHRENQLMLMSFVWGLFVAQLSFLAYHWSIAYEFFGTLKVSQFAIIITVIAFSIERFYHNVQKNEGQIKTGNLILPIIFSAALIAILLIFFN